MRVLNRDCPARSSSECGSSPRHGGMCGRFAGRRYRSGTAQDRTIVHACRAGGRVDGELTSHLEHVDLVAINGKSASVALRYNHSHKQAGNPHELSFIESDVATVPISLRSTGSAIVAVVTAWPSAGRGPSTEYAPDPAEYNCAKPNVSTISCGADDASPPIMSTIPLKCLVPADLEPAFTEPCSHRSRFAGPHQATPLSVGQEQ